MTKFEQRRLIMKLLLENIYTMVRLGIHCIPACFCALVFMCFLCLIIAKKSKYLQKRFKRIAVCILGFYGAFIFQVTIFYRPFGQVKSVDLIPFNTPGGTRYVVLYALINAAMFVPLGVLLPIIWNKMRNIKWCALVGFLVSVTIEVTQLILQCGVFQTEDMIMNTIGVAVGFWMWRMWKNGN